ncbi:MAG: tol-pal system protein YbgF [Oleibacter sp.]|nr:tol-pal system protein YbgF [Thalassolituus sp.]
MRYLALVLAVLSASTSAEDKWISVGKSPVISPAPSQIQPIISESSAPSSVNMPNQNLVSELLMQVEQLQQELALVRGKVEQQNAHIKRMEKQQQDRYIDLDRRMASLMTPSSQSDLPVDESTPTVTGSASPTAAGTVVASGSSDPEQAYRSAMGLIRERKYDEADKAFTQLISAHPDSPLLANSMYWKGEVNLVQSRFDVAEAQFRKVIKDYPDHPKVADASYKLGVTMDRAGRKAEAKTWLKDVATKYASTSPSTAKLAENYLKTI